MSFRKQIFPDNKMKNIIGGTKHFVKPLLGHKWLTQIPRVVMIYVRVDVHNMLKEVCMERCHLDTNLNRRQNEKHYR